MALLALLAAGGSAAVLPSLSQQVAMSVETSGGAWRCVDVTATSSSSTAAANGSIVNSMATVGWDILRVETPASAESAHQAFAAGCVEAKLTSSQTHDYWLNYMASEYRSETCNGLKTAGCKPPQAVVLFMEHQLRWLRGEMAAAAADDTYWSAMKLVMAQFDGFVQGIQQYATAEQLRILSPTSLYLLCSVGDLETINGLVRGEGLPTPSLATIDKLPCSGLISLIRRSDGTVDDIYAAQATWRSYYAMLRIYKVYSFAYYPQKVLTIASSPGLLHSKDDFLSSPTLYVAETTNMVSNASMRAWNLEHSNTTATSWQRSMIATGWASSGREWVELFSRLNNGCYNNQVGRYYSPFRSPLSASPLPNSSFGSSAGLAHSRSVVKMSAAFAAAPTTLLCPALRAQRAVSLDTKRS
eukprot:SAG11_NODE_3065_length_2716_cov_2.812763_2_plen_414_part_00